MSTQPTQQPDEWEQLMSFVEAATADLGPSDEWVAIIAVVDAARADIDTPAPSARPWMPHPAHRHEFTDAALAAMVEAWAGETR